MLFRKGKATEKKKEDSLTLVKDIFEISDILRESLYWILLMMIWTIIFGTALYISLVNNLNFDIVIILAVIGLALWAIGPLNLLGIIKALRILKNWDEKYLAYAYLTVFEFPEFAMELSSFNEEPAVSMNDQYYITRNDKILDDLTSKLERIYPGIEKALRKNREKALIKHSEIEGKKSRHTFDETINLKRSDSILFVRIIDSRDHGVQIDDLKRLFDEVTDVVRKKKIGIFEIILVSLNGYADNAVAFAANKENWIKDYNREWNSITLLDLSKGGYRIAWMPYAKE